MVVPERISVPCAGFTPFSHIAQLMAWPFSAFREHPVTTVILLRIGSSRLQIRENFQLGSSPVGVQLGLIAPWGTVTKAARRACLAGRLSERRFAGNIASQ